jgi:hypothetical protein
MRGCFPGTPGLIARESQGDTTTALSLRTPERLRETPSSSQPSYLSPKLRLTALGVLTISEVTVFVEKVDATRALNNRQPR